MVEHYIAYLESGNYKLKIESDRQVIKAISFVKELGEASEFQPELIKRAIHQLNAFFDGSLKNFHLPLAPEGTDFQKKVWQLLCTIPYGKTRTYAEMARQLGDPKVIRAAASANGKNPIAIMIPCHRVVGTNGSLTGYSGGLENKRLLLALENRIANGVLELF